MQVILSLWRRRQSDEGGIGVLEMVITVALLSGALVVFLSSLGSSQEAATFTELRARALDDFRTAAAVFSREARQAETIGTAALPNEVTLTTYVGGALKTVTWKIDAGDLQRKVDPAATFSARGLPPLLTGASQSGFTYDPDTNALRLTLVTRPSPKLLPVRLATEVTLRNA